jgi:hypothetical protein
MTHKEAKSYIRAFMQAHYTDERLSWLLAHARSGKLAYNSCCCFIGIPTSPHALVGERKGADWSNLLRRMVEENPDQVNHHQGSRQWLGGRQAELAYCSLVKDGDERGRRILIPMILAEMRRRDRRMDELARKMLAEVDREELAKRPGSWPL